MKKHKGHQGPLHDEFAHIRFPDLGPVHEGVFAVAEEGHEDVDLVLVGYQEVGAEEVGNDELSRTSQMLALAVGMIGAFHFGKPYPTSSGPRLVCQDHVVATPQSREEAR